MASITTEEVAQVFMRAIAGEILVKLAVPSHNWNGAYCGEVEFLFGDWRIVFFNDCDELDYTDSVTAPDGRTGDFEDWCGTDCMGGPLRLLDEMQFAAIEQKLKEAK